MGFYSWCCAKTQKPILNTQTADIFSRNFSTVMLLRAEAAALKGVYDGYGRVHTSQGVFDVSTGVNAGSIKLVLSAFYDGETFEQLPINVNDPGQGHFHDEDQLLGFFGDFLVEQKKRSMLTDLQKMQSIIVKKPKKQKPKFFVNQLDGVLCSCCLTDKKDYKIFKAAEAVCDVCGQERGAK
jgi:hypothetical protein